MISGGLGPSPKAARTDAASPGDDGGWHHLHPLSPLVHFGRGLPGLAVVLALPVLGHQGSGNSGDWSDVAVIVVAGFAGLVSWWVTRWRLERGVLRVDTGLVRRRVTQLPLGRIQSVDIVRPGAARIFGLAELRVRSGGSHAGDARLAYLSSEHAEEVRELLLRLAAGPAHQWPGDLEERRLARVSGIRLLVAIPLRARTVAPAATIAVVALADWAYRLGRPGSHSFTGTLAAAVVIAAALTAIALFRQYNAQFGYEISETANGLLLRGGVIGTVTETLAPRRVQALRVVEPWLWRPFGWAQLVADVAGGQHRKDEDPAVSGRLRILIPVAPRTEVLELASRLAGGPLPPGVPPPRAARLKAPLSYPMLRGALGDGFAVASVGRLRRLTTMVPLARVQSIRWTQGPVQRRLGLATVHLDVVGRRGSGLTLHDRAGAEADRLIRDLPALCQAAREAAQLASPAGRPAGAAPVAMLPDILDP